MKSSAPPVSGRNGVRAWRRTQWEEPDSATGEVTPTRAGGAHRHTGAVGAASVVHDDQPAGARVTGVPAIEHRTWLRAATGFSDLPELIKHMRALQARVSALEAAKEDQT